MMATTHLLAGLLIALPVAMAYPSLAMPVMLGAAVGSILPDLDLYYGHRRTLHYPTYGMLAGAIAGVVAIMFPHPVVVGTAFVIIGAAIHARMDLYGGGLELRPWMGSSEKAVFDHAKGRWLPPRRFIRYDGAPEDVAFAGMLAVPGLFLLEGYLWWLVVAALAVSVTYGLVRKPIVDLGVIILRYAPVSLLTLLPTRYLEDELADRL